MMSVGSRVQFDRRLICAVVLLGGSLFPPALDAADTANITRATLRNGLRVVIVRNTLAPVVTVELNYLAGANETPAGFPGMAHAQEHMAFRGCEGLSSDQTAAIFAQLGGYGNADTQQNITQYFTTVPAADLELPLRIYAACMQDTQDSQADWAQERGAIEQEVARDLSNPTYKFLSRLNEDMFPGTPYAHDALGTKESFDATTGEMLKKFSRDWYAPNNALLVVVGDVDASATMARIRQIYERIRRRPLRPRPQVRLEPVKPETFTLPSDLPYVLAFIAYRLPGTDSAEYAAVRVLADVLASQRGNLYALVPQGKALAAEFGMAETYPKASVGFSLAALPAGGDASAVLTEMKQILAAYASKGLPADLVEAAKRREIASAEVRRNSSPGLAAAWSQALAAEGRLSPDQGVAAIQAVKLEDVNRVARQYLREKESVVATLIPVPGGGPVAAKGFGGSEKLTSAPTKAVPLPAWAQGKLASLQVRQADFKAADMTLPNGLRLIVKTAKTSPTITVAGSVRHEPSLETPPGKDGVADILSQLFGYGTNTLDRLAFQKSLDDIAASETAGYDFSLRVLKGEFSRGVELLAGDELKPALPSEAFEIIRQQTAEFVKGNLASARYRAERAISVGLLPSGDPELREVTPETIRAITLDDVKKYHQYTIRPDLTTIVVIGEVQPEEARAVIEKWFGAWKASGPKPNVVLPPVPANKISAVTIPDPTELQDTVTLAQEVGINRYSPDYYALQLGNHVLGGGFYATRLYHDLRQMTGYVYNVDVGLRAGRSRTVYSVTYACDPKNTSKARDLAVRDLVDIQSSEVTPGELQQAKSLLLRQTPLAESSEDAVAGGLLARAQMDLPLDEPLRAAGRYFALNAPEVKAAFQKWIRPDAFAEVVRGPAPQ
jgi:zinc protease